MMPAKPSESAERPELGGDWVATKPRRAGCIPTRPSTRSFRKLSLRGFCPRRSEFEWPTCAGSAHQSVGSLPSSAGPPRRSAESCAATQTRSAASTCPTPRTDWPRNDEADPNQPDWKPTRSCARSSTSAWSSGTARNRSNTNWACSLPTTRTASSRPRPCTRPSTSPNATD